MIVLKNNNTVFLLFFLLGGDVLKEGKSHSGAPPCLLQQYSLLDMLMG